MNNRDDIGARLKQSGALRLCATELDARKAICAIRSDLADIGLANDQLNTIEIVLAEVFNNIVEHAYSQTGVGQIRVTYDLSGATLTFCVRDAGKRFSNGAPPAGERQDLTGPLESLPEGGFGWMLIRELTEQLNYRRHGRENILTFSFRLTSGYH